MKDEGNAGGAPAGIKIKVGVLGATGLVGQRFVQRLENHPWFEIAFLSASENSAGKTYQEACRWRLATPLPNFAKEMVLQDPKPGAEARIVFSSLPDSMAGVVEEEFGRAGYAVVSNSSANRMKNDVPLIIPEINAEHLRLWQRNTHNGRIVTNPNCSATALALALAPLDREFGIDSVLVCTLQAVSGAGYPGVPSLDVLGNVIPHIPNEEEKIERETKKIFGRFNSGELIPHEMKISAQTTRVPVIDAHTELVSVKLKSRASIDQVEESMRRFRALPQELKLPSAPAHPVIVKNEVDRPQPRFDAELENGMATVVGRIRACAVLDVKFILVGHNTIRGAAGGAILNAELLRSQGYLA